MKSYSESTKAFSGSVVVVSGDKLPVSSFKGELFYLDNVGLHVSDGKYWIQVIGDNGGNIKGKLTVEHLLATHQLDGNPTGNANTATRLYSEQHISAYGDANWAVEFDGSHDVRSLLTLGNTGVDAGTYNSVTVDTKGRVLSGVKSAIKTITEDYTVDPADEIIFCNGALTLTLVPIKNKKYIIKRIGTEGNITIDGMIDGVNGYTLDKQYQGITVISDGYVWYLI